MSDDVERVVFFMDYQNVHGWARRVGAVPAQVAASGRGMVPVAFRLRESSSS